MSLWTAEDAAVATGGALHGPRWEASGVTIDTREAAPGDLFVALSDRRDGHDFVRRALEAGAAAAMVCRRPGDVSGGAPLLVVPDVLAALTALGRAGRARASGRVVGVTGSAGKTSAKEMLRHVLAEGLGLRVHAAVRSFNNHWGVPLTLARTPPDAEVVVVEIGMNAPGEIAPLSRHARPHVALVTSIGPAHIAAFGSLEGIAREKGSIARGMEPGGAVVLPADAPEQAALREASGEKIITFGALPSDHRLTDEGLLVDGRVVPLRLTVRGEHHRSNAAGVLAVVRALGLDVARAAAALPSWRPAEGRGARERIALGGRAITLIDEAWNANPASMTAALSALPHAPGRRVAVLGDMLELGPDAPVMHAALARDPGLAAAHAVHTVGPLMRGLHDVLPEATRGLWFAEAEPMARALPTTLRDGDTVIVKGSKGIRVSLVVDALRAIGDGGARAPSGATGDG